MLDKCFPLVAAVADCRKLLPMPFSMAARALPMAERLAWSSAASLSKAAFSLRRETNR